MAHIGQLFLKFPYPGVLKQVALGLRLFNPDQRIGGDKLGFQVRQRPDAEILAGGRGGILVNDQRNETAQLADLRGNGLNIHAINAIFNQKQFAGVI
ncbi:MAG: hypothetical protein RBT80_10350, partial [Candidatus Vecturithrix sp.]|nr:hypothetical protein [Candidatus Vecturithrix sp.]